MDTGIRTFQNELKNAVTVQVQDQVINGVDGVLISIEGPSSKMDMHVTRFEAKIILEQLKSFLDKPALG